jgi:hypothetical protein
MRKILKISSLILVISMYVCIFMSSTAFAVEKTLPNGLYKVGTDIPVGAYTIEPLKGQNSLYYEIDSDNTNSLQSIVFMDKFDKKIAVILKDGQYLRIRDGARQIS